MLVLTPRARSGRRRAPSWAISSATAPTPAGVDTVREHVAQARSRCRATTTPRGAGPPRHDPRAALVVEWTERSFDAEQLAFLPGCRCRPSRRRPASSCTPTPSAPAGVGCTSGPHRGPCAACTPPPLHVLRPHARPKLFHLSRHRQGGEFVPTPGVRSRCRRTASGGHPRLGPASRATATPAACYAMFDDGSSTLPTTARLRPRDRRRQDPRRRAARNAWPAPEDGE